MNEHIILKNIGVKLQEMRSIAELHRMLNNGAEIHKVNLLRLVFGVKPGNNIKYRAASKIYDYAKRHGTI